MAQAESVAPGSDFLKTQCVSLYDRMDGKASGRILVSETCVQYKTDHHTRTPVSNTN